MTAPYKVDMATESVISHMAERIAALEAENAELKRVTFDPRVLDQMNALEAERDTLRQQLETARDALVAARHMIYYEDAPLGWNITRLDEALAAIGDAQPDKYCLTNADGGCVSHDPRCMHNAQPVSAEVKPIPDDWQLVPKEPTPEMCASFDDYSMSARAIYRAMLAAAPTYPQQPRQESEIAAEALEEAANWLDEHCMTVSAQILRGMAAQKRGAEK